MSMRDLLMAQVGQRLHRWEPLTPESHVRIVYVEAKLFADIQDPTQRRMGLLASDLGYFSRGGIMTVGYGRDKSCRIKSLDPRSREIWELRCKDPKPQVRMFGRFADVDVFVVTHACFRDQLGSTHLTKYNGNTWEAEIKRCENIWNQLFQGHPPHSGSNIRDYISENVMEIGKLP